MGLSLNLQGMRKRFGELLLDRGLITQEQLDDALRYQSRRGVRLGAALIARGHLTEPQIVGALGEALRVPVVSLRGDFRPVPEALGMVGLRLCSEHDLFPYALRRERGRKVLTVATSDPLNFRLLDELGFMTDSTIEAVLASATDIDVAIRTHYGPRLGRQNLPEEVRLALEDDADGSEMTIYRRGGGVEIVDTQTGSLPEPPPARRAPPREDSAVLLTEEVPEETPVGVTAEAITERPIPLTRPKGPPPTPATGVRRPTTGAAPPIPATPPGPTPVATPRASTPPREAPVAPATYGGASSAGVPTAPMTSQGPSGGFDQALGALIDAATEADHAEAILRLERKFWALMRVLAKKGLLTNEDFLAELGEEEKWRKS